MRQLFVWVGLVLSLAATKASAQEPAAQSSRERVDAQSSRERVDAQSSRGRVDAQSSRERVDAQTSDERVMVRYDFEEDDLVTGPYTLWVFEGAKGRVSLSTSFAHSGFRSVEIRDRASDQAFAELQGFFPDKWSGRLHLHFALLVAEPEEVLNVAFAGTAHFSLREHGLGVWLRTDSGVMTHVTGGEEVPLFTVEPFTWYVFDIIYDVDRGTYDLMVRAEGQPEPIIVLRDQLNVVGIPGSQLRKYSFIGDLPGRDRSNAWFYVDDIVVTSDLPVSDTPFVAPGRRMLFVDIHDYYQRQLVARPGCVPALGYEDFDVSPADLGEIGASSLDGYLAAQEPPEPSSDLSPFLRARLLAIRDWRHGCSERKDAVERFHRAAAAVPEAKIYSMSEVLALVAEQRFPEADALFLSIYSVWQDDPRFTAISASIGLARDDLEDAERWLAGSEVVPSELEHPLIKKLWSREIGPDLVSRLKAEFPGEWPELIRAALSSETRFFVLLWQGRHAEARAYAERMGRQFQRMELDAAIWLEREGDASFYAGDYQAARSRYEKSLERAAKPDSLYLKLSDTHFKLGELDLERFYREKIYGSLRPAR